MAQKAIKEKPTKMRIGHKPETTREELEVAAYYHWLNRGCPMNDDLTDWVEVEKGTSHSK